MSDLANQERATKQRWAVPGSSHDKIVRLAKIGLPAAVGVVIAFLAMAPLDQHGDVSFVLDKKKVENAPERMRVEKASYVGEDNRGQKFEIEANRALQRSSDEPVVDIWGMLARFGLSNGPVTVAANQGRYNLDEQKVAVQGPVSVAGPEGEQLVTRDVTVDLKQNLVTSDGGVTGRTELGEFQADSLRADLDGRTVVLDGRARLKIVQGAVR
ncbi:LPS export ABC transporter periplasmic protein LptC [Sphingomonas daechungensis]|uniref:LPS export ABC transporter periplasmic protein LptC n=1 Tax=Sphingomonas daechungensis TaxID=1176646 RepID=UPI0037842C7F